MMISTLLNLLCLFLAAAIIERVFRWAWLAYEWWSDWREYKRFR